MITVKNRINFWFSPNEKPTSIHVDMGITDKIIISAYEKVAVSRYPTLFKGEGESKLFEYPLINRPARQHVGDPAGINAWYTIQPVLECNGRYYELKELD